VTNASFRSGMCNMLFTSIIILQIGATFYVMTEEESDDPTTGINITLSKMIAYPVGGLLLLTGLASLINSVVAGILIFFAGLISLPVVRGQIKQSQGIGLSRWATVAIVLMLVVAGGSLLGGSDGGFDGSSGQPEAISQSATGLAPTVDDFDSGWQLIESSREGNGAQLYEGGDFSSKIVVYNVTVYENVNSAEEALQEDKPTRTSTEEVSIGNGGYLYEEPGGTYVIQFRTSNAVCYTGYNPGSGGIFGDSEVKSHAERCEASISENA